MTEIVLGSTIITLLVVTLAAALLFARRWLLPSGAVLVTVNGEARLHAARGDRLLSVLQSAGIAIPAACGGNGTCGLCRVTATGIGAGEAQATERGLLSAAERRAMIRLACQVSLRGPVEVTLPEGIASAESLTCPVLSNRMLAPLIRELVLQLPADAGIEFRAGQFMQITAPPFLLKFSDIDVAEDYLDEWEIADWPELAAKSSRPFTRAYSIANRPQDRDRLVFNIRLAVPPAGQERAVPPGVVSSYLFSLKPGDAVAVSGPYGEFGAQPTGKEMIFIGGGVGMAPLRAMVHEQLGQASGRKLVFFFGARTLADLYYSEEFEDLAAGQADFTWVPALSDPAPGDRWLGATGFVHEVARAALATHRAPEDCEYYLCGPPMMISAVRMMLARLGVEGSAIFFDDFGG